MEVARGQLERMCDAHDFFDARCGKQRLEFAAMLVAIPNEADPLSLPSAAQMRLAAAFFDPRHNVVHLLFSCFRSHDHDHCSVSLLCLNVSQFAFALKISAETYEPRIRKFTLSFSSSAIAASTSGSSVEACKSR